MATARASKKKPVGYSNTLAELDLPKSAEVFDVLGTLDELNSVLGFLYGTQSSELRVQVRSTQKDLQKLGAWLAGCKTKRLGSILKATVRNISNLEAALPRLHTFIIPGGSTDACWLHFARTVCRRLERDLTRFLLKPHGKSSAGDRVCLEYVNKLSYLLFLLARKRNIEVFDSEML